MRTKVISELIDEIALGRYKPGWRSVASPRRRRCSSYQATRPRSGRLTRRLIAAS